MINFAIGERIRRERKRQGITQAALAERIGVSNEFMCRVENGRSKISVERLTQISEELHVSMDMLAGSSAWHQMEYAELLSDCSQEELRYINPIIRDVKQYMRNN